MKKLTRLWRHFTTNARTGRRAFTPATLKAIQTHIAAGEAQHRAEVRIIIESALSLSLVFKKTSTRVRAHQLFSQYRIWDTNENCGILIYINLADRKVEIIADRGVARQLAAEDWQRICKAMTEGFAEQEFHHSTIAGLTQLNLLLEQHFPAIYKNENSNQLSDQAVVL